MCVGRGEEKAKVRVMAEFLQPQRDKPRDRRDGIVATRTCQMQSLLGRRELAQTAVGKEFAMVPAAQLRECFVVDTGTSLSMPKREELFKSSFHKWER